MLTDPTTSNPGSGRHPGSGGSVDGGSSADPPSQESVGGRPGSAGTTRTGGWRRLALHAVALLVVTVAMVLVVDNGSSAITDEGAVIAQVDAIADGDWRIELPLPEVDPDGDFVTMELSDVGGGSYLPYAKHPAYPVVLVPFWDLLGHRGLLLASAIGAWAAAVAGMLLSRRLTGEVAGVARAADVAATSGVVGARRRDDIAIATLWILSVGSPLVFDATVVMAHGTAAALTGFLVLAALQAIAALNGRNALAAPLGTESPRSTRWPVTVAWGALALALAVPLVLLRSEGLLAVGGVAAALCVTSFRSLRPLRIQLGGLALGGLLAVVGAGSYLLDGRWSSMVIGDTELRTFRIGGQAEGLLEGRSMALWASVLRPGDPTLGAPALVLFVATLCMIAGAVLIRRRGAAGPGVQLLVVGAGLTVARLFLGTGHVTGLLAALPLLAIGLLQLRRSDVRSRTLQVCLVASAVAGSAVLATSYSIGGAAEWGGRFYHVLLPLLVPPAVLGLARGRAALPVPSARVATAAVVVSAFALSILCLWTGRAMREDTAAAVDHALGIADASVPPSDGGPPILVTDDRGLGRVAWDHLDDVRILRVGEPERTGELLDALADAQLGSVVLAVHPYDELGPEILGEWRIAEDHVRPGWSWRLVELEQAPPPG